MKKLVVILGLVAMVGVAQAACFNWVFAATSAEKGKTAYVFNGSAFSKDMVFASLDEITGNSAVISQGVFAGKRSVSAFGGVNDDSVKFGSDYTYFYVVADESQFYVSDLLTASSASIFEEGSASPGELEFSNKNITYKDYSAVPEPTTAALLALGLAAFGLKRKVRA